MIACPNKRLKVWKDLVNVVGENKAHLLWAEYEGNVPDSFYQSEPIIQYSKSPLEDELKAVLEYFKMTKRDRLHQPQLAKGLKTRVEAVNKRLGYEGLVYQEYYKGNKLYMRVGIKSDQPSVELKKHVALSYSNWFNSLSPEQQRSENALREQDGLPPLRVERQKSSPMSVESKENAQKKIDILQKIFDVEVEYDTSLDAAGAVVPGPKPKIIINPDRLKEDTVIHEFAHIFIDALGGLSNTLVLAAVNKLRGTDVWNEVKNAYPELDDNNLAKEVLATAMGRRGSEIFKEEANQSWWDRFVRRIVERIAAWFKKDANEIDSLVREMFSSNSAKLQLVSNDIVQFSKSPEEAFKRQKELDAERHSVQKMYDKAISQIKTKLAIVFNSPSAAEGYEGYEKKLVETIDEIEKLAKTSPILGLHKFLAYATSQLHSVDTTVKTIIESGNPTPELINKINLFTGVFENIEDFIATVEKNKKELTELGIPIKELEGMLHMLLSGQAKAQASLKDARRRVAAYLLADGSNYAQGLAKQRFQIEANKLGLKGVAREKYIHDQMVANKDNFFKENVDYYYNLMETTVTDIDGFEAWVLDATNINSHSIQILHSMINNAQTQIRQDTMDDKADIANALEKLVNGAYVPSKVFEKLTVQGSDGLWYLRGKYNVEFQIKLTALTREVKDALDKFGKDSKEHKEAEAKRSKWLEDNTRHTGTNRAIAGALIPNVVPTDNWLDKTPMSKEEKEFLEFTIKTLSKQDSRVPGHKKLGKVAPMGINSKIYQLPGLEQKTSELLIEKGAFTYIKDAAKKLVQRPEDETEYGQVQKVLDEDKGYKEVFTYESGEEKKDIPIFYRTQPKNQSLDLPTLLTMNSYTTNNYKHKYKIMPKVSILLDATSEKEVGKSEGSGLKKLLVSANTGEQITFKGSESNEYKVMKSIVDDTIFGMSTIDLHSTILGADVNTILRNLGKWTSDSMLILNYLSAGANLLQGKTMNLLEMKSNGALSKGMLTKGESLFWSDSAGWVKDVGEAHPTSKTSLLMDLFNVKGDYRAISTHFFKNSKAASLASWDRAHFLNGMGEFYTAGALMYSILSDIKIMNKDHKYLDKDGNIVETKEEAASLVDIYSVKDGKLVIDSKHQTGQHAFTYTTMDYENVYNPGTVSNYIKKVYSDLHGQYDNGLQSMAQRHALGKLAFMLRKWMLPGMLRRWRGISTATKDKVNPQDKFYSQALMREMEGNYTTAVRFIVKMKRSLKDLKFDLAYRMNWDELNDYEKANIRRTVIELSIMAGTLAASLILRSLAKGIDDDDEAQKTALMLATFWTRRLYSEMSFYVWPGEMIRILRSPAASVSMVESTLRLLTQVQRDIIHLDDDGLHTFEFERYERGPRKGEPKLIKKVEQVVPVFKNVKRDVEDATDYLWNTF